VRLFTVQAAGFDAKKWRVHNKGIRFACNICRGIANEKGIQLTEYLYVWVSLLFKLQAALIMQGRVCGELTTIEPEMTKPMSLIQDSQGARAEFPHYDVLLRKSAQSEVPRGSLARWFKK
jgi:hypothetical protein